MNKKLLKKYTPQFTIRWMPKKIEITQKEIIQWKNDEKELKIYNVIFNKSFQETYEKILKINENTLYMRNGN